MITLALIGFPFLAGLIVLLFSGSLAKKIAVGFSLLELALLFMVSGGFDPAGGWQFEADIPWVQSLGIHIAVGMDGLSYTLVLLTTLLVPFILIATVNREYENPAALVALILMMEGALVGVFTAKDAVLFYLFWEAALIPVYFIAGLWSGPGRIPVFFKFFVYTIFGSLFMLLALAYLYLHHPTGELSTNLAAIYAAGKALSPEMQSIIFWMLFLAFAIKMPIFPFHTWQPDTYTESATPATMLLSGIMLKMGIYGAMRWLIPVVPAAVIQWSNVIMTLSVIGIVYGAIIAIQQRDMKRLIAFSSFSHVGLMAAGIFSGTEAGMQGATIQMLAHGVTIVGLFYIVDLIQNRTQTREIARLGGITQASPSLSVYFTILVLGAVALPLTSGFVGEFLLLKGVFEYSPLMGAIAGLTIILGAVYTLRMFQGVMFGPKTTQTQDFAPLTFNDNLVLFPLCFLVFWIGMYPASFMDKFGPSVSQLLQASQQALTMVSTFTR